MEADRLLQKARAILMKAVESDQKGEYGDAITWYADGTELLMKIRNSSDLIATKKEALNRQISDYISRAESLKRNKPVKVEFVERISIEEESVGYDYAAIFNRCLNDNISAVEIEDPFIIHHHQIVNFVMLNELLILHCKNLKEVKLITKETNETALNELYKSLESKSVELKISISEKLHDREIRFYDAQGRTLWIVKLGRGLDYFMPSKSKYAIGAYNYKLRPCKKTSIDIFRYPH